MARGHRLNTKPIKHTNLADQGGNMYKFYMAHCLCEIISRYRLNQEKLRIIYALRDKLSSAINPKNIVVPKHQSSRLIELQEF